MTSRFIFTIFEHISLNVLIWIFVDGLMQFVKNENKLQILNLNNIHCSRRMLEEKKSPAIFLYNITRRTTNIWTLCLCKMNINAFTFPLRIQKRIYIYSVYKHIFLKQIWFPLYDTGTGVTVPPQEAAAAMALIFIVSTVCFYKCLCDAYQTKWHSITIITQTPVFIWLSVREQEERRKEGKEEGRVGDIPEDLVMGRFKAHSFKSFFDYSPLI